MASTSRFLFRAVAGALIACGAACGGDTKTAGDTQIATDTAPDTSVETSGETGETTCQSGTLACACAPGNACDDGLRCASGVCETCAAGGQLCACKTGNTCDDGLQCLSGTCYPATCQNGTVGCPCDAGDCSGTARCADGTCVACTSDIAGCPCDGGACSLGLVCDAASTLCRAPATCADLSCVTHQKCQAAAAGADAVCLAECDAGFVWNANTKACDKAPELATCNATGATSILAECAGLSRRCVADVTAGAVCGACLPGLVAPTEGDPAGACRAARTCTDVDCVGAHRHCGQPNPTQDAACGDCWIGYHDQSGTCVSSQAATCDAGDPSGVSAACSAGGRTCVVAVGGATCGACTPGLIPLDPNDPTSKCSNLAFKTCAQTTCGTNENCFEGGGARDAYCVKRPCDAANEAYQTHTGLCIECQVPAFCGQGKVGETGAYWATTLADSDKCLCETVSGYYAEVGLTGSARECDADADGWVRIGAERFIDYADPAVRANARCALRTVASVRLHNELGQTRDVTLCAEPEGAHVGACTTQAAPAPLYEPTELDTPSWVDSGTNDKIPTLAVGGSGRKPTAKELNPLTKFCAAGAADYNQNLIADRNEHHRASADAQLSPFLRPFIHFAYFGELYRGFYEPTAPGAPGRWVIQEIPRWDPTFPLGYPDGDGTYWKGCTRNRDAAYSASAATAPIGMDFAEFSCDATQGTCPTPPPPAGPATGGAIPAHGLDVAAHPFVADAIWRGMSHHSQFKCAVVASTAGTPATAPQQIALADVYDAGTGLGDYVVHQCRLDAGTSAISMHCEAAPAPISEGAVGFVSVRYQETPAYQRGCISEWTPSANAAENEAWRDLCPGHAADPAGIVGGSSHRNSGAVFCGCGYNYGGAACDAGCVDAMYGGPELTECAPSGYCPVFEPESGPAGRVGVWMCGSFVGSFADGETLRSDAEGPSVTGHLDVVPAPEGLFCGPEGCKTGPAIRHGGF